MELPNDTFLDARQYGKFSALIKDYLLQEDTVSQFYMAFPQDDCLLEQAKKKLTQYPNREIVHSVLSKQMKTLDLTETQIQNLEKFKLSNTVTITTGHQLNLLTGPLYFFYKILQTIRCCEELNYKHPEINFIPIFWMATEDHDFTEINHFYHKNKKFSWEKNASGAVGRLNLDGLSEVFHLFFQELPHTKNAQSLRELIEISYLESSTLTEATRKLVQALFGNFGLLMIDGDDAELKKLMIPYFQDELVNNTTYKKVMETNEILSKKGYSIQVNPRDINLFYLGNGEIRNRIVFKNGTYSVLDTPIQFSEEEILKELQTNPEKFSPNALLRPFYQENILPNIAYIGGSAEIAYWLELKSYFDTQKIIFPLLIFRNSVLVLNQKQKSKLEKLEIDFKDLLKPLYQLVADNVMSNSDLKIDFELYEIQIRKIFEELAEKSSHTDITFANMVNAQRTKQLKGLENMKKRLIKAEKKKHSERTERIQNIYNELFPNGVLQERIQNFSDLWLEYGKDFINDVYDKIHPYEFRFIIKTLP